MGEKKLVEPSKEVNRKLLLFLLMKNSVVHNNQLHITPKKEDDLRDCSSC